jgi:HlyD family secretion protein/Biotin-lipoyl like
MRKPAFLQPRMAPKQDLATGTAAGPRITGAAPTSKSHADPTPEAVSATIVTPEANASAASIQAAAMALLQLQAEMRRARSRTELAYFLANEPRRLLRAQQIVVLETRAGRGATIRAVSSLTNVDRSSPLVLWFESMVSALERDVGLNEPREFDAAAYPSDYQAVQSGYPLRNFLWVPWIDAAGRTIGGSLLARSTPWNDRDIKVAMHLAGAFAHAWGAFDRHSVGSLVAPYFSRRTSIAAAVLVAALMLFPVSMTALAPVEVVPRDPFVVTSGVEGVIKNVHVAPNEAVVAGQVLITLSDTVLKNRLELAEREVAIAETKHKKSGQLAFIDVRGRHELAIATTELELKRAERAFARELLERTQIKAEREGIAFFADKRDLVGRPITVGEKLMEIASPDSSEFQIDLSVADAIVLGTGVRVKVFLDSDPLHPIEARLIRAAYKATLRETQQLAFRLVAETQTKPAGALRLGVRGTAQIYSDRVLLGFYLFRRPIAAARQWLGL